jgi:hypothetical protein
MALSGTEFAVAMAQNICFRLETFLLVGMPLAMSQVNQY